MGASSTESTQVVIKEAKKTLKKSESGSLKIKSLAKTLVGKFEKDDSVPSCKDTLRKWIEESDKFQVDGKMVSLKDKQNSGKKRKSVSDDDGGSAEDENGKASKKAKKAAKKAKKEKKKKSSSAATATDSNSIEEWRKANKIVLRDPRTGEEGAAATKGLASNASFYPYQSFDSPGCVDKISAELINQCTKVNGFQKPSPIQAQCWPVQLSTDSSGRHQDVVGIAETGSGKSAFTSTLLSFSLLIRLRFQHKRQDVGLFDACVISDGEG